MIRQASAFVLVGLGLLASLPSANAGWSSFWNSICRDYKRNTCWPEPLRTVDRRAAQAPFITMVANGWRAQNTFTERYFDTQTGNLTYAGRQKLRSIMFEAPVAYRTVFVLRDDNNPDVTADRIEQLTRVAGELSRNGDIPPILETDRRPRESSADYINSLSDQYIETIPPPRLEDDASSGSSTP